MPEQRALRRVARSARAGLAASLAGARAAFGGLGFARAGSRAGALGLLAFASACSGGVDRPPSEYAGRDVVLVVVDTLRADRLGLYGAERETAPFLAQLAQRALVFRNARSVSSWTAPATASLFTSVYPDEHGVETGLLAQLGLAAKEGPGRARPVNRIPDALETLGELMAARGYSTWALSSNPNVSRKLGFDAGFERFELDVYGQGRGTASDLVDRALAWREKLQQRRPYFLYLHFMDPHEPDERRAQWVPEGAPPPPRNPYADRVAYDSEISYFDHHFERLYRGLGLEDAVVIVTADHGQEFFDHGGLGHGFQLYSELTRVPLILALPGPAAPRGAVEARVSLLDLLPTLRELSGAAASQQDDGISLLTTQRGEAPAQRTLFSMRKQRSRKREQEKRGVLHEGYELIEQARGGRVELYDLTRDPHQKVDLSARDPERARELQTLLDAHRKRLRARPPEPAAADPAAPPPDPAELEALKALGYVEPAD